MRNRPVFYLLFLSLGGILSACQKDTVVPQTCEYQDTGVDYTAWALKQPLHIVALGSSSTAGAGASAPQYGWVNVFQQDLKSRGLKVEVENMGRGGDTTTQMTSRLQKRGLQGIDLLIVQPLSNDVLQGKDLTTMQQSLNDLKTVMGYTPAAVIGIQNFGRLESSLKSKSEAQQMLIKWTAENKYPFIDRDKQVTALGHTEDYMASDSIHPNDKGHALIAQCTEKVIFK